MIYCFAEMLFKYNYVARLLFKYLKLFNGDVCIYSNVVIELYYLRHAVEMLLDKHLLLVTDQFQFLLFLVFHMLLLPKFHKQYAGDLY